MIQTLITLTAGAAIAFAILAWSAGYFRRGPFDRHTGPTVEQVRALAHLVSAKVTVTDVVETRLDGYLGGAGVVLAVRGEALLGPDLSAATFDRFDRETRTAVLRLPSPTPLSCRIDHSATRIVSMTHTGLWRLVPGDAGRTASLHHAFTAAEQAVTRAAHEPSVLAPARTHAQTALTTFFATGGWRVEIRWSDTGDTSLLPAEPLNGIGR